MQVQPVGIPADGDGRIRGTFTFAVLSAGFEEELLLAMSEYAINMGVEHLVPLPQAEPPDTVTGVLLIVDTHGVVKQAVHGYDLHVGAGAGST
jgi:hypothetical protein